MSSSSLPRKHTHVLIIGGGPAGSYAAAALAREGIEVTLLEASKFPRYHIGESLIPSVRHYLRYIDAEEKMVNHGFIRKPGSAIKFNQFKREGYTDFVALGCNNNAWNVVRSEFDQMLLNHARSSGAAVYEKTRVESIAFSSSDPDSPISVSWLHTPPPPPISPPASPVESSFSAFLTENSSIPTSDVKVIHGVTKFTYMIDATGRAGILSTRYLKNRHFNASLKNIAVWGYWSNVGQYGAGTSRHGSPWFETLTDASGWAWFIPLHNGTTSIGIVMNEKIYKTKFENPLPPVFLPASNNPYSTDSTMTTRYLSNLSCAPGVMDLITKFGVLDYQSVKSASDFSYSASSYAGNGYRIIGDAGAFIDPFFSSGVHLAMTSALSAAATIIASIRKHCSEKLAAEWHTRRVAISYTRFQVVVLSAYKQIRSQSDDILSDINEDNYDRAFAFLRPSMFCLSQSLPVIQGASDMGARLSETELQKSLDFCVNLFNPTTPEQHEHLSRSNSIAKEFLDVAAPVVDPSMFEETLFVSRTAREDSSEELDSSEDEKTEETKMILNKINARRIVHPEYAINNLELEALDGYVVRLEQGKLGLTKSL
ncbi:FAD binding domain-containing protein [Pholiota conissans]|uniref:FAD binding domain-containing protein n=1 Tax=Pholiota conissans TaxID=109636 RepID=A0A9P6CXJ2_9AGAR|nr:FAD binding domain-containing protein [Pholiota conissans]